MRRIAVLLAVPAALALAPHAALSQGSDPITFRGRGTERQQYLARVRNEVETFKSRWAQAWESDDARALADLYTRDAVVVKDGQTVRSARAIRDAFARDLPTVTNLQTKAEDFHTSGDLAYEMGTMTYVVEHPGRGAEMRQSVYFLVLERQGDASWKIQSQMLGAGPGGSPTAQQGQE